MVAQNKIKTSLREPGRERVACVRRRRNRIFATTFNTLVLSTCTRANCLRDEKNIASLFANSLKPLLHSFRKTFAFSYKRSTLPLFPPSGPSPAQGTAGGNRTGRPLVYYTHTSTTHSHVIPINQENLVKTFCTSRATDDTTLSPSPLRHPARQEMRREQKYCRPHPRCRKRREGVYYKTETSSIPTKGTRNEWRGCRRRTGGLILCQSRPLLGSDFATRAGVEWSGV